MEQNTKTSRCCKEGHPKCPYTYTQHTIDSCCIGCDKPGIGSPEHNPSDNSCSDCALFYCPCALVLDIFCFVPMSFGYCLIEKP